MRTWALAQSWDAAAEKFIKHFNALNERITIFAGAFNRQFDGLGSGDGKPLGGSEEAVIAMAHGLADAGKEVFVYCHLPDGKSRTPHSEVKWRDASTFDPAGPHGTLLAWRAPKLMSKLKGNGYPVILWLMDPEYGAPAWDYAEADDVVFLTHTHRDIVRRKDGYDGGGSVVHIGLPELPAIGTIKRDEHSVMWATSPDRGLLEFLQEVWPDVIREVPDAKLNIFYGLEPLEKGGKEDLARAIRAEIKESTGVFLRGGVPDEELYDWYERSSVFAFRCVGFEETLSVATLKAMAMGCYPVVNTVGCLPEVIGLGGGLAVPNERYTHELIQTLKHPIPAVVRSEIARRARQVFSVESMTEKMLRVIDFRPMQPERPYTALAGAVDVFVNARPSAPPRPSAPAP